MKDFTHKDCCINCENFCFWNGDYCCFPNFKIHQYNITYYPEYDNKPNKGYFSDNRMFDDIDNTMVLGKDCEDYHKWGTYMYVPDYPNEYLEEYKRFKEWDKLCYQLEQHVSDPSGYYEKITKPKYFKNINNIPINLDEAIKQLDKELNEDDKKYLLKYGALSVHHSLGRWIRNTWKLWDNHSELKTYMKNIGCIHPDDISNYIIEKYIDYIKS